MGHKPQFGADKRNQEIAELKAGLDHATQVIIQLQQQNIQLQKQVAYLQGDKKQPSRITWENASIIDLPKPYNKPKNRLNRFDTVLQERRFEQLSRLQIAVIALLVATGFTSIGLIVTRVFNQPHPIKPSTNVPKPPTPSPPASLIVPVLPQKTTPSPLRFLPQPLKKPNPEVVDNFPTPTNFPQNQNLQATVNELVNIAARKGLPTESLSITLVNLKTGESAGYKQQQRRFPASVAKLFWLVNFYDQVQEGVIPNEAEYHSDLIKMIQNSDNEAASRIVDLITGTESGLALNSKEFEVWLNKRKKINDFFKKKGYKGINVSQKTFPIPYLNLYEPKGRDLQMRGDPANPIRNKITTQQAARLLYNIVTLQAVPGEASEKMLRLLTLDPATRALNRDKNNPNHFNPVRGFLSQSLPDDVNFVAKSGWTSNSRQEAAYIQTRDGKAAYILVIFAEDRAYAYDWKIFPRMSSYVFERMVISRFN